ncbi:hypothetical protein HWV62_13128 [Athelia sp. TMB]|nr:hypothetical protein HWV62_13128 [Athelia sp. TMB]
MHCTLPTLLAALCAAGLVSAGHPLGPLARTHPYRHRRHHARTVSSAAVSAAEGLNKASASASVPVSEFTADADLPAVALAAAALKLKTAVVKYQIDQGSKTWSSIYSDWATSKTGSAYVFTSNMDIDCDGTDYQCLGNSENGDDGDAETAFGKLAAYETPYIVIPQAFQTKYAKALPGNNVVAVICDGKMYYGIFGDTNGASPEVIGEASWRMGQACFPDDNISGENGHGASDVTYIVFTGADAVLPAAALTETYITNFGTLKSMGDSLTAALVKNIGLSDASGSAKTSSSKEIKTTSSKETKTSSSKASKTSSSKKATATIAADFAGDDDNC